MIRTVHNDNHNNHEYFHITSALDRLSKSPLGAHTASSQGEMFADVNLGKVMLTKSIKGFFYYESIKGFFYYELTLKFLSSKK